MIYLQLFWAFFKIGAFTFGGGYAMIPLIEEAVIGNHWLEVQEFIDFIAVSESTPGAFAINISTYVGTHVAGFLGAVCCTVGVVLPSFLAVMVVIMIYDSFKKSKAIKGIFSGLRPAVVGLIGAAIISIGMTVLFQDDFHIEAFTSPLFWESLAIFGVGLFCNYKKIHPILIILISASLGLLIGVVNQFVG